MISKRRGFCPQPLRSPDPDTHNRSMILPSRSPDVHLPRHNTTVFETDPHSETEHLKTQNSKLKLEIQQRRRMADFSSTPTKQQQRDLERLRDKSQENQDVLRKEARTKLLKDEENRMLLRELQLKKEQQLELDAKDRLIEALKLQIDRSKRKGTREIQGLQQRIRQLENENERLHRTLQESDESVEYKKVNQQRVRLQTELRKLQAQNEHFKSQIGQLEVSLEEEVNRSFLRDSRSSSGALDSIKRQCESRVRNALGSLDELLHRLQTTESRVQDLSHKLGRLSINKGQGNHARGTSTATAPTLPTTSKPKRFDQTPIALGDLVAVDDDMSQSFARDTHKMPVTHVPDISRFADTASPKPKGPQRYDRLLESFNSQQKELEYWKNSVQEKDRILVNERGTAKILSERVQSLKRQHEQLTRSLNEANNQSTILKLRIRDQESLIKNSGTSRESRQLELLRMEVETLRSALEGQGRVSPDVRNLEHKVEGLQKYILGANETIQADRKEILRLNQENNYMRGVIQVWERSPQFGRDDRAAEKEKLYKQQLAAKQEAINNLKKALRSAEAAVQQLRQKQSTTGALPERAKPLPELSSRFETQLNQEKVDMLQRELNQMERVSRASKEAMNQITGQLEVKSQIVYSLQQQVMALQTRLDNEAVSKSNLQKTYDGKCLQLQEALRELAELKQILRRTDVDKVETKIKERRESDMSKLKQKDKVIKISIGQNNLLKRQNDEARNQTLRLRDQVSALSHQNQVLQSQIQLVRSEREALSVKSKQLSDLIENVINKSSESRKATDTPIAELSLESSMMVVSVERQSIERQASGEMEAVKQNIKNIERLVDKLIVHVQGIVENN